MISYSFILKFQTVQCRGASGWLNGLNVWRWLRLWSHGCGFESQVGLCAHSSEYGAVSNSASPSLSCPIPAHALSLSKINIKNLKKKKSFNFIPIVWLSYLFMANHSRKTFLCHNTQMYVHTYINKIWKQIWQFYKDQYILILILCHVLKSGSCPLNWFHDPLMEVWN